MLSRLLGYMPPFARSMQLLSFNRIHLLRGQVQMKEKEHLQLALRPYFFFCETTPLLWGESKRRRVEKRAAALRITDHVSSRQIRVTPQQVAFNVVQRVTSRAHTKPSFYFIVDGESQEHQSAPFLLACNVDPCDHPVTFTFCSCIQLVVFFSHTKLAPASNYQTANSTFLSQ